MVWYGNRLHAATFFRKSLEIVFNILGDQELMAEQRLIDGIHKKLVWDNKLELVNANGVHTGTNEYICYDGICMGCGVSYYGDLYDAFSV